MKISLDWLSDFVDLTEKDNDVIKTVITARSAEIETMENGGEGLDRVVVGKIVELRSHPNADKLRLTMVDNGSEKLQVVCGGSNLKEGMKVAFAQIGAVVKWHGSEVVKMEKAKIRGEESYGMICASDEIGLEEMFPKAEAHEIVDLSHLDAPVGTPLAKALGLDDTVIDIDNHAITHRADLFSHHGFAREFVANGLAKWKKRKTFEIPKNGSPLPVQIRIDDKDLCRRYLAVYLTNIEVGESPDWTKRRLAACGVRPISNLVDITNYVMLELGMPLHAFDLDQVKGKTWTMRPSKKGEKVITLDEKEIELFEGTTVLDDGHELFDLCGIMGGLHSGINQKTTRVLLHAPVYDPVRTRRAMRGLGHISDAGIIYEKGVDPELAEQGLARAVELILELCPSANVASEVLDITNSKPEKRMITLRADRMEGLIGLNVPEREAKKILTDLGFGVADTKNGFEVEVPSWRLNDVRLEADLIEEVARVHGYDNIPTVTPVVANVPVAVNHRRAFERQLKERLTALGFNEIYIFAFLGPELLKKCGMQENAESVVVENPISSDLSVMRQSLLPWTLQTVADNLRYQKTFRLFELARIYRKKSDGADERSTLIMAGANEPLRDFQGAVESLGFRLEPVAEKDCLPHQHPGRTAWLTDGGKKVGQLYELHPQIRKNFDLKPPVMIAEVDMEAVHALSHGRPQYQPLPKYPSVQLDVSALIPKKELAETFLSAIRRTDAELVKAVELIDEYEGKELGENRRALTFSITYRADNRTLTEKEVEAVHEKVLNALKKAGAEIRD